MVRSRYLWAGLAFLAGFITLGIAVHSKPTAVDLTIAQFFASHRTQAEIRIANIASSVTAPFVVGLVAIGLLAVWNYRRQRWSTQDFIPLALIAASGIATTLAKSIFNRLRPGMNFSTIYNAQPGFPSSHTVFIAAAGSSFLFIFAKRRPLMVSAIVVATVFMGLDRLVLGVHWFTDLIGAALLSLGLFFLFASINQSLRRSPHDQTG